jgi:hypothetical protein
MVADLDLDFKNSTPKFVLVAHLGDYQWRTLDKY